MNDIVLSIISVTIILLLLISGIVFSAFRLQRQRVVQQQKLNEVRLEFQHELRKAESEVSEGVLTRLATDLHDNIGQLLTAARIEIENRKLDYPECEKAFRSVDFFLGEATQQLRILSRTLNSDYLGKKGLLGALNVESERLRALKRFELKTSFDYAATPLDKDAELMVFRIFQEVVQNILKHAEATQVEVSLVASLNDFSLKISDNGRGFDFSEMRNSDIGSGISNIVKRTALAGLTCDFQTMPGHGTKVLLKK